MLQILFQSLTVQRKMAENLAIARVQEEAVSFWKTPIYAGVKSQCHSNRNPKSDPS